MTRILLLAALGYRRIRPPLFHRPRQQRAGACLWSILGAGTAANLLTRDEARRIAANALSCPIC